jgi:hypothetical protein
MTVELMSSDELHEGLREVYLKDIPTKVRCHGGRMVKSLKL